MAYAPGSFSKNFAWHGTGLRKLRTAIKAGYRDTLSPVDRQQYRADCGLLGDLDLIPINFFLHNKDGQMSVDELVIQAIERLHTIRFDRLGLFALHLNRAGSGRDSRSHREIAERPAMWANEFVRERLWSSGSWRASALPDESLDPFLEDRMAAQRDVRIKCRNNFRHLFVLCEYWPAALPVINSGAEQWLASALFLAWDRFILDGGKATKPTLLELIRRDELYKLMGISEGYLVQQAESLADLYLSVGNLARFGAPAPMPEPPEIPEETGINWLDEQESDEVVGRRRVEVHAQNRDRKKAAALKQHYENTCTFCGVKLQIAEDRFYSEAAHIKPLGQPHDGPDKASNMLVLCPNHHLQFDRGILRLRQVAGELELLSKVPADPLHRKRLTPRHAIDNTCIDWHRNWFSGRRG